MTAYDAQDAPETDEIHCVTSASAPTGGEIRLLPVIVSLADGPAGRRT